IIFSEASSVASLSETGKADWVSCGLECQTRWHDAPVISPKLRKSILRYEKRIGEYRNQK
ncbi:hypothetical protein NL400_27045, partial [Klebsiella pneumoniae]|nr:hypothetical protein [Klebsiella pneumoniae]